MLKVRDLKKELFDDRVHKIAVNQKWTHKLAVSCGLRKRNIIVLSLILRKNWLSMVYSVFLEMLMIITLKL